MKYIHSLLLAIGLGLGCSLSSCHKDQPTIQYHNQKDCIIREVQLEAGEQVAKFTTDSGKDTLITTDLDLSSFGISIDQFKNRIYNLDSLPQGTNPKRIFIRFINATGKVTIRSILTGRDIPFSEKDTIDFSVPRLITVWSADEQYKRRYLFKLNIHQQTADQFQWSVVGKSNLLEGLTAQRTFIVKNRFMLFGNKGAQSVLLSTSIDQPTEWTEEKMDKLIDPLSVVHTGDKFYALAQGKVMVSQNGLNWSNTGNSQNFMALLARTSNEISAVNNEGFWKSKDGGKTFELEGNPMPNLLPVSDISGTSISSNHNPNFKHQLIVGQTHTRPVVWKHNVDISDTKKYDWFVYPQTNEKTYFPKLIAPTLLQYGDMLIVGGKLQDGKPSPLYCSSDDGLTWTNKSIILPQEIHSSTSLSLVIDHQNYLYVICGGTGQIWKGRFNYMGWNTSHKVYE